jgi:formate dehydrogenase major subunit
MKAWFALDRKEQLVLRLLPKLDKTARRAAVFDDMHQGKMNGYICQGFNPIASFPNKAKLIEGMSKLKYLVIIDPLATETSEFWKNFGEFNNVDSAKIQTEVFRLPSTCFAEEDGSLVSSGRWLQWHWKGAEPPAEAKGDPEISRAVPAPARAVQEGGGAFPESILNLTWNHLQPESPSPDELAREFNGKALADVLDEGSQDGSGARRVISSTPSRICATTAAPAQAAGSSAAPGTAKAT